jgi:hypothetical protein
MTRNPFGNYSQQGYADESGNTIRDLYSRLRDIGALCPEMRLSDPSLPWNQAPMDFATLLDPISLRLQVVEDTAAGRDIDGRKMTPEGKLTHVQRTKPLYYTSRGPGRTTRHTGYCLKGHDLTIPGALHPTGNCAACNREAVKRYQARKKAAR